MVAISAHTTSIPQVHALAESVGWILLAALPVVAIIVRSLRVVGEDERLVVRRLGRLAGVRGPGLVVVWPGLERDVRVSLRLVFLDLYVEAITRDSVTVRIKATAVAAVADPVRYAMTSDEPLTTTTIAAEGALRQQIAHLDLADLPALDSRSRTQTATRISDATGRWGVQVTLLDITDIQIPLKGGLLAWAEDRARLPQQERHPRG
ncbi:SPFH domain-containing protein [Streptosporangium sp. KLBMP 9127]|nr:SPFH/Band 7/PHB domain protein [Streptosporangium sp. KLBMP 9127]